MFDIRQIRNNNNNNNTHVIFYQPLSIIKILHCTVHIPHTNLCETIHIILFYIIYIYVYILFLNIKAFQMYVI